MTAEELEEQGLQLLPFCTLTWSVTKLDGDTLECNAANAVTVYQSLPWLKEQVAAFVGDRANFLTD